MGAEQLGLLLQYPLVGIFIWFVLYMRRQDAQERAERDKYYRQERAEWRQVLEKLVGAFQEHDINVGKAVEYMKMTAEAVERTSKDEPNKRIVRKS